MKRLASQTPSARIPSPRFRPWFAALALFSACGSAPKRADLGRIYDQAAQHVGNDRNPVVVLPGVLGSKLSEQGSDRLAWGAFVRGAVDADTPAGARIIALPMGLGQTLAELTDDVTSSGVLDTFEIELALVTRFKIGAYIDILRTLAVGDYRDQDLARSGAVDYGGLHSTCFQFAYDWRRDISEQALALDERIHEAQRTAALARDLPIDTRIQLDVIGHSMGGLVLRYYLRYGTQVLPEDGSLPELNWAGAQNVRRAFLVGTPNAGSAEALDRLVDGLSPGLFAPNYRPAVLGTMPALYQLLPRTRHARIVEAGTGAPIDLFDVATWIRFGWGLADPDQVQVLRWLLPEALSDPERRTIALDHLAKCLARAEQLQRALDLPATPPKGLELQLFLGDAIETASLLEVDRHGARRVREREPGDGTVTRSSALMDERLGRPWSPRLKSPIQWSRVQFLPEGHLALTRSVEFSDNLLYQLLEAPH